MQPWFKPKHFSADPALFYDFIDSINDVLVDKPLTLENVYTVLEPFLVKLAPGTSEDLHNFIDSLNYDEWIKGCQKILLDYPGI